MENYRPPLKRPEMLVFTKAPILRQWYPKSLSSRQVCWTQKRSFNTTFELIFDKAKLMELLMLCYIFLQWKEDLQAKNIRILQPTAPLHRVFVCNARLSSATSALGYTSGTLASRRLENLLRTSSFRYFSSENTLRK